MWRQNPPGDKKEMKPNKQSCRGAEIPRRPLTVIARLETGGGHPALSGLKFLRIVSREEGTDPASNRAARNPGGDPV